MGTWDELERLLLAQGRDGDGTVRTKHRTKIGRRAGIAGIGHGVGNSSLWWCVARAILLWGRGVCVLKMGAIESMVEREAVRSVAVA